MWRPVLLAVLVCISACVSPGWTWTHGNPIAVPAPAQAFGYVSLKFSDDFSTSGTIDLANSKSPQFKWFLSNPWPNSTNYTTPATVWRTAPTISAANVVVSGGKLTINNDPGGFGYGIGTAVANGASLTGQTFGGGYYAEFSGSFTAQTPNSGKVAAFWAIASEFLLGSTADWGEIDHVECTPIASLDVCSASTFIHEEKVASLVFQDTQCNCGNVDQANPPISHNGLGNLHTWGTLWVPAAQNGGTGIIRRYFDGQEITSARQDYSVGGLPNPSPSNQAPANGQFSEMDSQHMVIFIGADSTIPITIDWVRVWQLP